MHLLLDIGLARLRYHPYESDYLVNRDSLAFLLTRKGLTVSSNLLALLCQDEVLIGVSLLLGRSVCLF